MPKRRARSRWSRRTDHSERNGRLSDPRARAAFDLTSRLHETEDEATELQPAAQESAGSSRQADSAYPSELPATGSLQPTVTPGARVIIKEELDAQLRRLLPLWQAA